MEARRHQIDTRASATISVNSYARTISYGVVTTTIRLRFDGRSTT